MFFLTIIIHYHHCDDFFNNLQIKYVQIKKINKWFSDFLSKIKFELATNCSKFEFYYDNCSLLLSLPSQLQTIHDITEIHQYVELYIILAY